jgi:hypothetical protein
VFVDLDFLGTRIDGNDTRREAFGKLVCEVWRDRLLDRDMRKKTVRCSRYKLNVRAQIEGSTPNALTDWTEFCMVLAYAFYSVQLHVDALSRTKLRQDDIRIRGRRRGTSKDGLLFTGWYPGEVF